ncbi:LOW QUALITY PROTEIN: hypothetical protein HID58_056326 [Brassica napus]|uniref:Cytochrome P450 n=1 Tax=Brassica napus TaxID=3708 RepID=A0ABQ8AMZ3_BRANA|nr:LOW QUALITY PROTEIN: hypothetical protein HID58_056326 [Brassica napus]
MRHPQPGFQNLSMSVSRVTKDGTILDLQDVFQRFIFDTTLVITTRSDPQSLSIDMPQVEFAIVVDHGRLEFLNKLVYLHGVLYETMRLYPPIRFESKTSIKSDVLPSGHRIDANPNIIFLIYAEDEILMGRRRVGIQPREMDFRIWWVETLAFFHKHSGYIKKTLCYPWNWPVLGMLPAIIMWYKRIDVLIWVLEKSNMTFLFKGPWFTRMDLLFTVDPANIQHILSSNFTNYIKGPEMKEIFDVYGDAIFTADGELWRNIRMSSMVMFNHQGFQNFSMSITTSKLKDVLLPLFSHYSEEGTVVDLQDVFGRFMLDTTLLAITGSDPQSLSIEMPEVEFAKA